MKYEELKKEIKAEFEKPRYKDDFPWAVGPWGAILAVAQDAVRARWHDADGNEVGIGPEDIGFPAIVEAVAVIGVVYALANRPSNEERAAQWETIGAAMLTVSHAASILETIYRTQKPMDWKELLGRFLGVYNIEKEISVEEIGINVSEL